MRDFDHLERLRLLISVHTFVFISFFYVIVNSWT